MKLTETQIEAQEIIHNATAAYRAGEITFTDWLSITRLALLDGFLSVVRHA
jgi:predicted nucleic-acid-binding protein